jgi:hypothetical protein
MSRVDDLINRIHARHAVVKLTGGGMILDGVVQDLVDRDAMLGEAEVELDRLRGALLKIADRYPCGTMETMQRLARETLGIRTEPVVFTYDGEGILINDGRVRHVVLFSSNGNLLRIDFFTDDLVWREVWPIGKFIGNELQSIIDRAREIHHGSSPGFPRMEAQGMEKPLFPRVHR